MTRGGSFKRAASWRPTLACSPTARSPPIGYGRDLEMMRRHLGWLEDNARRSAMEAAFETAGFVIDGVWEIGTEWREYLEERSQPASKALLRLSRLRRQRDDIVRWRGQEIYDHIEANLHYEVFLFLGKLEPVIDVLRRKTVS